MKGTAKLKMVMIVAATVIVACRANSPSPISTPPPTPIPANDNQPVASPTDIPTLLPTLMIGGGFTPTAPSVVISTPEIIENFAFPKVADTILDNSGIYQLQAGITTHISWLIIPSRQSVTSLRSNFMEMKPC